MDDDPDDLAAYHEQLLARDERERQHLDAVERNLRRCTCPLSHQIAGVCPKLEFLARFRELGDVVAGLLATRIEAIPECTAGDARPFECTCRPMHYCVLATCPKRKPELLVPNNGNKGSRCRTDNYGGTGDLIGHVGAVLSAATISAHRLAQHGVTAAELVVSILSRDRDSEAKEAADMLTNRTLVDWNPRKEAISPAPSTLLPVNLPVTFKTKGKAPRKGVYLITKATPEAYEIESLSDGSKHTIANKDVSPNARFAGVKLLVDLPHGCTATNEGAKRAKKAETETETWTALVSHEWAYAVVSGARRGLNPGDEYAIPPFKIDDDAAAPAVCGVVFKVLEPGMYLLVFAWVIAIKNVHVHVERKVYGKGKQLGEKGHAPYRIEIPDDNGEIRTFSFHGVPIGTRREDDEEVVDDLLDLTALNGARRVTETAAPTVAASSTLLYTASTRITVDILLAMLTCVEPDEDLRVGRINRLFYLASSARVLRRKKEAKETPTSTKDALRLGAILVGIELCAETRALINRRIDDTSRLGAPDAASAQIATIEARLRRARRRRAVAWDTPTEVLAVVTELEKQSFLANARHEAIRAAIASAEAKTRALLTQYGGIRFGSDFDAAMAEAYEAAEEERPAEAAEEERPAESFERTADEPPVLDVPDAVVSTLDEAIASGFVESGEVSAMTPIAVAIVSAYVPLLALRRSFFDKDRVARPDPRGTRHAVKVSGAANYTDYKGTVFVPMIDEKGNEWLEAGQGGDRYAIVGSQIVRISGGTCTTLAKKDKSKWPGSIELEDLELRTPTQGSLLPCDLSRSLASTRRENKKKDESKNKPMEPEERARKHSTERGRTLREGLALRALARNALDPREPLLEAENAAGLEAENAAGLEVGLNDARVDRARAATSVCFQNMSLAKARHGGQAPAALECDMRLYEARARIAELLLSVIDQAKLVELLRSASEPTWADTLRMIDAVFEAPAFGGSKGAVRAAAQIVCAVRGLAEDESGHAAHVRALEQSDAGRRISAVLLPALPFGRALVAALGAACPSFGRRYV